MLRSVAMGALLVVVVVVAVYVSRPCLLPSHPFRYRRLCGLQGDEQTDGCRGGRMGAWRALILLQRLLVVVVLQVVEVSVWVQLALWWGPSPLEVPLVLVAAVAMLVSVAVLAVAAARHPPWTAPLCSAPSHGLHSRMTRMRTHLPLGQVDTVASLR